MYDLAHLWRTARRRWLVVAVVAIAATALLLGWSRSRPERFEASGVVVLPSRAALESAGVDPVDVDRVLGRGDELVVLETGRSSGFRRAVAEAADVEDVPTRDELFVRQVQGPPGSRIETGRPVARITALAGDAGTARRLEAAAAKLLAEEASRDVSNLADEVPQSRRAALERAGAVVGTHVDERRVGRSSRMLAAASAGFIGVVLALLVLVALALREPRQVAEHDIDPEPAA